jgi:putative membrane protein
MAPVSGLGLLALIWLGPLVDAWHESFAAHMLAHMGVVAISAPLIAIGIARSRKLRCRDADVDAVLTSMPVVASLAELIVVWGWHAPAARAMVERSNLVTVFEQASFLAVGVFLWMSCLRPGREGTGAFALLLTSVHMTLLGALLALSPRPLYGTDAVTCFGAVLGAGQDQQLGGVVMLMVGAASYLAGGLFLLARLLGSRNTRGACD